MNNVLSTGIEIMHETLLLQNKNAKISAASQMFQWAHLTDLFSVVNIMLRLYTWYKIHQISMPNNNKTIFFI